MIKIRPVTQEVLPQLSRRMIADDHEPFCQTHVIHNEEGILGSLSLGVIPFVTFWMDTKRSKIRETLSVISSIEAMMSDRARGGVSLPLIVTPVAKDSQMYPYVPKLGYRQLRTMELFLKEL